MAEAAIELRWFKVVIRINVPAVTSDLIQLFRRWAVQYYFGSLFVKLTPAQVTEIRSSPRYKDTIELRENVNVRAKDAWVVSDNKWDLDDSKYALALMSSDSADANEQYYSEFVRLFKTDKSGALVITKGMYDQVATFAIRFAGLIKTLCGLQAWVPRLSVGDKAKNKVEMFRLFVSAYPAYHNLCRNQQFEDKFYWNYNVEEKQEGSDDTDKTVPME